ncbi:MAG: LysM peptidoglycan-binding domain-containing protein [Pseudomonadota bacterium]
MSNQKLGVAIFAGLLIVTGIVSSGQFFDANALLDRFMERSSSDDEMASLPEGVEVVPDSAETEPAKPEAEASMEAEAPAETTDPLEKVTTEPVPTEKPMEETAEPAVEKPVEEAAAPEVETPMETVVEAEEAAPAAEAETAAEDALNETEAKEAEAEAEIAALAAPPPVPPVFDLLRVEPNGDMVVAGVASPGAEMELVAGTKTLTKTTANANGEFVAILDEALNPGDYEIVLRSTDSEGVVMTSAETAIVSIPEAGSDEVIALVEAPGEPSRLITVPEVETASAPAAESETAQKPSETEAAEAEPAQASETTEDQPVETANVEPAPEPAAEPAKPAQSEAKKIRIEAVEIDGPTVFVAGAAEPGTKLRIYANEILLGDAQASAQGRFLIEVNRELPVGDYIIRADALSSNSAEVVMRAAVPFTRSAGEKLAAVAVPATTRLPNEPPKIEQDAPQRTVAAENTNASAPATTIAGTDTAVAEPVETASAPAANVASSTPTENADLDQPLTPVDSSVVIRRGDTLWHISKRVYGQGIKYTTIYKANDEQIRDPDMIWPGQVFTLPDEADENNN